MIQRLKDCWLILTGKGTVRVYDDDPWVPRCGEVDWELEMDMYNARRPYIEGVKIDGFMTATEASLSDQSIEEIAASLVD